MKYSILKSDATAYKDGVAIHNLDMTEVPSNVRALQFNDAFGKGHLEFELDSNGDLLPNQEISELPSWVTSIFSSWDTAKAEQDAAIAAAAAAEAAAQEEWNRTHS